MRQQDDAALDEASRPWCMEKNTVYYRIKRPGALRIVGCVLALRDALGLGGGSRPTGVLVQRWVQQRGVRGAAPGDFFTILINGF